VALSFVFFVLSFFRVFVIKFDSEPMTDILNHLGPNAPTQTNEQGGKQSAIPVRCDLFPARAVLELAAALAPAAIKYGEDNWRRIPRKDHVNHALAHNPIVTLQHCYSLPPVGKSVWRKRYKDGDMVGVKAKTQYPKRPDSWQDTDWPPDTTFSLIQAGHGWHALNEVKGVLSSPVQ
jgi:hypothetical protein